MSSRVHKRDSTLNACREPWPCRQATRDTNDWGGASRSRRRDRRRRRRAAPPPSAALLAKVRTTEAMCLTKGEVSAHIMLDQDIGYDKLKPTATSSILPPPFLWASSSCWRPRSSSASRRPRNESGIKPEAKAASADESA